jgi:flagellar biosynthesis protein FlhB
VVAQVRGLFVGLGWPLAAILCGFAAGALAAHQMQVRGLWAIALIAPSPRRLWVFGREPGLAVRAERGVWSIFKAAVLVVAALWTIRTGWSDVLRLGDLEGPGLARGAGQAILRLAWVLAAILLALGLFDYGLRQRRFELMLRTTTAEQREDRRVIEGDPATRAQRRRVARALRSDSAEVFTGASLILSGTAGLTLILAGGPPPRRVTVRSTAKGHQGMRLRRSAEAKNISQVDAPDLARRLARRPSSGSPLAAELIAELAAIWPTA